MSAGVFSSSRNAPMRGIPTALDLTTFLPSPSLLSRSFFQSLCVLGYCVLPLTVAMLVCRLVLLAGAGTVSFIVRLVVVVAMFGWSMLGEYLWQCHAVCAPSSTALGEADLRPFPRIQPRGIVV